MKPPDSPDRRRARDRRAPAHRLIVIMLGLAAAVLLFLGVYGLREAGGTIACMGLALLALACLVAIRALIEARPAARSPGKGWREVPPPADFIALWPLADMRPGHDRRGDKRR